MSSKEDIVAPLLSALRALVDWFQIAHVSGMVIGGVASSFLGRPRVTRDIDAVVLLDNKLWKDFLKSGEQFGFYPRIEDSLSFAQKNRVLLVKHNPSGIDADISFGALPFEEEAVSRAIKINIMDIDIPLPTPEDLIIMKAVAHRPVDMADIQAILDSGTDVDLRRIRYWVKEFATVLEIPEILNDLEKLLPPRRP